MELREEVQTRLTLKISNLTRFSELYEMVLCVIENTLNTTMTQNTSNSFCCYSNDDPDYRYSALISDSARNTVEVLVDSNTPEDPRVVASICISCIPDFEEDPISTTFTNIPKTIRTEVQTVMNNITDAVEEFLNSLKDNSL